MTSSADTSVRPQTLLVLRAGMLEINFDPKEGTIHYVKYYGVEAVRGISAPVRNPAWATVPAHISNLSIKETSSAFQITFLARCRSESIDFEWDGQIEGTADGRLTFRCDGVAKRDFQKNRIGICVLHPAELAGMPCDIVHTDGSTQRSRFPEAISPACPFSEIDALAYAPSPKTAVFIQFAGDVFETEDQRNWTDASFKTYCTPLRLPYPVGLAAGSRVQQSVTISVRGSAEPTTASKISPVDASSDEVTIEIGECLPCPLPRLGTLFGSEAADPNLSKTLSALRLSHFRVDLRLSDEDYNDRLRSAEALAKSCDAALEIALFVNNNFQKQLKAFRAKLAKQEPVINVARWFVFHENSDCTPLPVFAAAQRILPLVANAPIGGGATENFAELNRCRNIARVADMAVFGCNPQVHTTDTASIIETLTIQAIAARNAQKYSAKNSVALSPITLTRRWRALEANPPAKLPGGLMPFQNDSRLNTAFAAVWAVASICHLAQVGVNSLTYFEAAGTRGLLDAAGTPRPIFNALGEFAPFAHAVITSTKSSSPNAVVGLGLVQGNQRFAVLCNLNDQVRRVRVVQKSGQTTAELAPYQHCVLGPL